VRLLTGRDEDGVPVLASDSEQVVGWLNHRTVFRAYRARLDERPAMD
jgi:hypothetical protein